MKGKAESHPNNHVVWVNGFKSNMPDWPTARRVAVSDRAVYLLREVRTLLFSIERRDTTTFDQMMSDPRWKVLFESLQEVVEYADLGIQFESRIDSAIAGAFASVVHDVMREGLSAGLPLPIKPFPKPPGVK